MNKISLNRDSSIEWLKAGKILIHPIESIWGIGCDAFNRQVVEQVFRLKKRDLSKGFILLAESLESIEKYIKVIGKEDQQFLSNHWLLKDCRRMVSPA